MEIRGLCVKPASLKNPSQHIHMPNSKLKACLLVNMISPARLRLYSALADYFDLFVLHGGAEANRAAWRDAEKALPNARVKRAWGWQVSQNQEDGGTVIDRRFVHVTPGYVASLLQFDPDVIITNEMGFRTVIALAYGALFRRPVWVWWGGTPHTERNIGVARKILRRMISRWAQHWISYGRSSTEYLASLGIAEKSVLEIQNAVDENRFAKDTEKEFQIQPRPVLLHVGQLIARKGVGLLLQAAASLQCEGCEFSLMLVGSGADERPLKELTQNLGLRNVHFCLERPPERMPAVYRSADVLVFPTIEDVWGLVANEAILSGLPVLCSRYAGCAQELLPEENVFDPRNREEFKEKLRAAIDGQISRPDPSRLRTTPELAGRLIQALESSVRGSARVFIERTKKPARIQTE
jgi:glycosyltransferase involved in cell wall biosynthesis